MTDFYIEFEKLGTGVVYDGTTENITEKMLADTAELTPTGSSLAGSRPIAPAGTEVTAVFSNAGTAARKVSWGADPDAATDTKTVIVLPGAVRAVHVPGGSKIDVVNA